MASYRSSSRSNDGRTKKESGRRQNHRETIHLKMNRNGGRVDKVKFDERVLPEVRIHQLSN